MTCSLISAYFLELIYQLGILRFKRSKTAAQLIKITNKLAVTFIAVL
jgi:hypothetical protein